MTVIYPELSANETLKGELPFITQADHYKRVVDMGIPFLTNADQLPELNKDQRPVVIIGGGQSLMKIDKALTRLNARDDVIKVVTGSTHKKVDLGELQGVTYCVIGFAKEGMTPYFEPRPEITYIVAAQSHPAIFEKLQAARARVFAVNGYVEGAEQKPEGLIGIGNTSATAGLAIFAGLLGRKDIEIYGVDSSMKYSYDVPNFQPEEIAVKVPDGRTFAVDKGFYEAQTVDLVKFAQAQTDISIHVHGDSVNAALVNPFKDKGCAPVIGAGLTDPSP